MKPIEITQIVPQLPPTISGVGDYAWLLARRLRAAHDVSTRFIVCDPSWDGDQDPSGASCHRLDARRAEDLQTILTLPAMPRTVLLHYAGYGYQRRGCPMWLVRTLESWKNQARERRLIVMFHELFAFGPPWRSSFWTSPLQRQLAKSLASLSDHCVTNLKRSAQTLSAVTARAETDFTVLPVFSNVGEPIAPANWTERKPRMIVFGGAAWRRQVYLAGRVDLARAVETLGIREVVDIGPQCGGYPKLAVKLTVKGVLAAESIDRELADARAGFFTYPVAYLGKSGIFAAYAAHGLLPVTCADNTSKNQDGLLAGEHFLRVSGSANLDGDHCAKISRQAFQSYRRHDLNQQAARYASILGQETFAQERRVAACG